MQQLEQTAPETIQVSDNDEIEEEEGDEEDENMDEEEDEEDSEEESDEAESEDEANLQVDPEFRRRVAEALQVSGMGVDGEEGSDDEDEESDEEVWDDEQMLKVDEKLAEVFRQRANAGKSKDFKSEPGHILTRNVLLTVQTYMSNPSTSRLVFLISSKSWFENNPPTPLYFT